MAGRRVLLTSDVHMFRARRAFEAVAFAVSPRPFPYVLKRSENPAYRLPDTWSLFIETIKIGDYWGRRWIPPALMRFGDELKRRSGCGLAIIFFAIPTVAQAQPIIHVYEYETLNLAQFTLEQHLNYWAEGSKQPDGTVAPTNDRLPHDFRAYRRHPNWASLGFMQLNGVPSRRSRSGIRGMASAGPFLCPEILAPAGRSGFGSGVLIRSPCLRCRFAPCRSAADSADQETRRISDRFQSGFRRKILLAQISTGRMGIRTGYSQSGLSRRLNDVKRVVPYY